MVTSRGAFRALGEVRAAGPLQRGALGTRWRWQGQGRLSGLLGCPGARWRGKAPDALGFLPPW